MNDTGKKLVLVREVSKDDKKRVCDGLYEYNVAQTESLLQRPGIAIDLVLKDDNDQVMGGIFCDTFLYCLYIDVLWVDEKYRNLGYGKKLITEAERIAKESGCKFVHTTTFSYQSPGFYQSRGYETFAILDEYLDGIKQYFLKKRF
jgi:ribosomal protein S18 acetylase RimI-like enzyme